MFDLFSPIHSPNKTTKNNLHIPGMAIAILDVTTWVMALLAAVWEVPTLFPFLSTTGIPSLISLKHN